MSTTVRAAYRAVTSNAAQRALLYAVLLASASSVLYAVAVVGYIAFYYEYVPHRVRSTPVHLQYGPALSQFQASASAVLPKTSFLQRLGTYGYHAPYGLADLRALDLKPDQDYDVSVVLSLPLSPANRAVGNFMVELVMAGGDTKNNNNNNNIEWAVRLPPANARDFLEAHGKRVVFAAARPAILAYTDPLVARAKQLALLPVHFFAPEAASRERLIVPMAESLSFAGSVLPAILYVELRTPGIGHDSAYELQTYGAEVVFSARLRGLRWLMYHHRVFSFVVLTTTAWAVEVACMAGMFVVLGAVLGGDDNDKGRVKEEEDRGFGGSGSGDFRHNVIWSAPAADVKKESLDDRSLPSVPAVSAVAPDRPDQPSDEGDSDSNYSADEDSELPVIPIAEMTSGMAKTACKYQAATTGRALGELPEIPLRQRPATQAPKDAAKASSVPASPA